MFNKLKCFFVINLSYTKKTLGTHLFIFIVCNFLYNFSYAKTNGESALNSPSGSLLAHLGLGVATNGDTSIVDINPALLAAIDKQYSLFGNLNFHNGFDLYEVGIVDTVFTPVAALLKARQTTHYTDETNRRIELALAYRIPKTNLSLGALGEYEQHHLKNWKNATSSGWGLSVGGLYQINYEQTEPLFIGASVNNIFNRYIETAYNLGISKAFVKGFYSLHLDGTISNLASLPKIAGGIDIKFREFFILSGSVGWNFDERVMPLGGGIYFNGPRLKAFYSIGTHQANTSGIWQSTGLVLTF